MWLRPFIARKYRALKPGGAVSLIEGPFKGFKGLYSKRSKDRVEVLLTLLGQQQRILVPSQPSYCRVSRLAFWSCFKSQQGLYALYKKR